MSLMIDRFLFIRIRTTVVIYVTHTQMCVCARVYVYDDGAGTVQTHLYRSAPLT